MNGDGQPSTGDFINLYCEIDRFGDVFVDTRKSIAHYEEWKCKAKPAPGPGGLRRPDWLNRPLKPVASAYHIG